MHENEKYPGKPRCYSEYEEKSEFCKKVCKYAEECKKESDK
jgi:hypothetical protein